MIFESPTTRGVIIEVIPKTANTLKILDPNKLPNDIPFSFL